MALEITSTVTELPKPVNVLMSQTFLRRASQHLPYFIGSQAGEITKQQGTSTIKWRRIEQEDPTQAPLAELDGDASFMMGRDADTPTFTDIVATLAKYGQFYIINEEVDLYNPSGTLEQLTDVLGESAGRSMNGLQRDNKEDNFPQQYSNGSSDAEVNTVVSAANLAKAIQTIQVNSARTFTAMTTGSTNIATAPILPSYWAINHPYVSQDVASLTGFKSVETYAGQVQTAPGEYGYFSGAGLGLRLLQSEDASIDLGAGAVGGTSVRETSLAADVFSIVVFGQDADGSVGLGQRFTDGVFMAGDDTGDWEIIVHGKGSGGISDPFNEISTIAWKSFHAAAVLNTNWGVSLRCAATLL